MRIAILPLDDETVARADEHHRAIRFVR